MMFPDLRPLAWLAIVGLVCGPLVVIGGLVWLIVFIVNHVRFV